MELDSLLVVALLLGLRQALDPDHIVVQACRSGFPDRRGCDHDCPRLEYHPRYLGSELVNA